MVRAGRGENGGRGLKCLSENIATWEDQAGHRGDVPMWWVAQKALQPARRWVLEADSKISFDG